MYHVNHVMTFHILHPKRKGINDMDKSTVITNVTLAKVCSIKPDSDSTESKKVTLNIKYDGLTLGDVLAKAVRSDVISWQNGPGRRNYEQWGEVVNIDAKAPGSSQVDPESAMVAKLKGMSPRDQQRYINEVLLKR